MSPRRTWRTWSPSWTSRTSRASTAGRKLSLGSHGYAQMWDDDLVTLVHRWMAGAKPRDGRIVDHLSGDRLDDRKFNLRFVTAAESSANVRVHAASGFPGVYPNKGRWATAAKICGRKYHLGTYDTPTSKAPVRTGPLAPRLKPTEETVTEKYPVTAERMTMYDAIDATALPAHTVKAAGYVNGQWPSYAAIVERFPAARVHAIDVFGNAWLRASILDYEEGNVETYKKPDMVRDFVIGRNEFRPQTACIYCNTSDLADIEDYLQGLWHVIWAASWGENGTVGNSLTGTRTAAGNLIVATQLQNTGGYDMSDSLGSW